MKKRKGKAPVLPRVKGGRAPRSTGLKKGLGPGDVTAAVTPASASFVAELEALKQLKGAWLARHRDPPAVLYHYTNAQGLHGMLSSGRVWATNVSFLNDPSEMRYATRLIRGVLTEEAKKLKAEQSLEAKPTSGFSANFEKILDEQTSNYMTWTDSVLKTFEDQGDAYMSCFCTDGDLLSQWRGYGATGGGYALGFGATQIGTPTPKDGDVILRRVIYKAEEQQEIVSKWVGTMVNLSEATVKSVREIPVEGYSKSTGLWSSSTAAAVGAQKWLKQVSERTRLLAQGEEVFKNLLAECSICFKDPAYAEEQEWRVIQFGRHVPEIKFRASGPRIVPYVELALTSTNDSAVKPLPLKSITYGPTLEPAVTEKSLNMILKYYKYKPETIEIRRSGIPFRI